MLAYWWEPEKEELTGIAHFGVESESHRGLCHGGVSLRVVRVSVSVSFRVRVRDEVAATVSVSVRVRVRGWGQG